jgi:hypothetical protein
MKKDKKENIKKEIKENKEEIKKKRKKKNLILKKDSKLERSYQFLQNKIFSVFYKLWVNFQFTWNEIKSRKMAYTLGVLSCFVVVFSVLITATALTQLPIIFFRLAEIEQGENDMV